MSPTIGPDKSVDGCRTVREHLDEFLDGECAAQVAEVIRRQLTGCHDCVTRAEFHRQLRAAVAAKCTDCAPPGLLERVLERLAEQVAPA